MPLLAACAFFLGGEELEGSVSVQGNVVILRVNKENDRPAPGAAVKLMLGDEKIAEGVSDANGFWMRTVEKSGKYEVWLRYGAGDDDIARIPVTVTVLPSIKLPCCQGADAGRLRFATSADDFAWLPPLLGVSACLAAIGCYVWFRSRIAPLAPGTPGEKGRG